MKCVDRRWVAPLVSLALLTPLPQESAQLHAQVNPAATVDDILDLVQVSSARISPDGLRVLFTRSELKQWKDNKRATAIWIADADGGGHPYRFLSNDADRDPSWSPDGRHIAFLSTRSPSGSDEDADKSGKDEEKTSQIWVIRAGGGEAWKLTDRKAGVRKFEWASDSERIFFAADEASSADQKAAEKAGDDALFVDEGANGQERGHYADLWVVTLAGGTEHQITKQKLLLDDFMPSPDGARLAVTVRPENIRNHQYKTEVAVIDVASGQLTALTKNEAPESDVRWSPDGALVSFKAPDDKSWTLAEDKLWVVPAAGGSVRRVSDFQGEMGAYFWAPDGKTIHFGGIERGRSHAFQLDIATGRVRARTPADSARALESISVDGKRIAGIMSTPGTPPEVFVTDVASGRTWCAFNANPAAPRFALSRFRPIIWKSADGLDIEGLLWLPADYEPGTRLPLILSVHGGPAGVWTAAFRGINHVYTGLGWAVLEPNVRGSSSYGDALLQGNMKDIGGGDYQDLMTGVDTLIAQGLADPDRLAIRGWSYGGILGGWTITQTPRFKAASLGAMVTDWASEYAMGFNHDVRLWYISGTPWENPGAYQRQSSYTHIAKVTTPTILFHGERDTTDTIGQSMIFYQGLKDRAVPVRFIRFPREPHGFLEPHHQRIRDVEEIAWLMKYARGIDWKAPDRRDDDSRNRKPVTTSAPDAR